MKPPFSVYPPPVAPFPAHPTPPESIADLRARLARAEQDKTLRVAAARSTFLAKTMQALMETGQVGAMEASFMVESFADRVFKTRKASAAVPEHVRGAILDALRCDCSPADLVRTFGVSASYVAKLKASLVRSAETV